MPTNSQHKEHADNLIRELTKLRTGNRCERCGRLFDPSELEPSHFIPRQHLAVRWAEENVDCFCKACHADWEHKKKIGEPYYVWKLERVGWGEMNALLNARWVIPQYRAVDYVLICKTLRERIKYIRGVVGGA